MTLEIKVAARKLAEIILANAQYIGSTDWGIYVHHDGEIDCRHSTHEMSEWIKIVDLHSFFNDDETLSSTIDELAEWIKADVLNLRELEQRLELDETVSLSWC